MDDVGRLWRSLAVLAAVSLIMGFFTACGSAILRLSDLRLSELAGSGKKGQRIKRLHDKPEIITHTNLAARTLIIIALAGLGTEYLFKPICDALQRSFSGEYYTASCAAAALLIGGSSAVFFSAAAVIVPKRICAAGKADERFISRAFGIYRAFLILFKPAQLAVSLITAILLALFGVKRAAAAEDATEEEILQLIDASDDIEEEQAEMISNIFEFSDLEVHDIMTHRTEICAVELGAPAAEAVRISVETGVSRIPVYQDTIDNIRGVIYIKDLLPLILQSDTSEQSVSDYLHKVKFVPETANCGELFRYFTENKKQIAIVLDEYGGTAGLVTMEDLLESIVGSIRDEYDENEAEEIQEITPNTFDILGSADPDEVMEKLGHTLDEEHDYDTIGGFVTDLLGYIPEDGQTPAVKWKNIIFRVIKASDNRIVRLRAMREHKTN